jgi:hypothetical protein
MWRQRSQARPEIGYWSKLSSVEQGWGIAGYDIGWRKQGWCEWPLWSVVVIGPSARERSPDRVEVPEKVGWPIDFGDQRWLKRVSAKCGRYEATDGPRNRNSTALGAPDWPVFVPQILADDSGCSAAVGRGDEGQPRDAAEESGETDGGDRGRLYWEGKERIAIRWSFWYELRNSTSSQAADEVQWEAK